MPTPEADGREPAGVDASPADIALAQACDTPKYRELSGLPIRPTHHRSVSATFRTFNTRNRALLERVAAGLRRLDHPAVCKNPDPIRGRAHAIHLMADHSGHRCPRFRLASQYIEAPQ